jgi:hypothetical protein
MKQLQHFVEQPCLGDMLEQSAISGIGSAGLLVNAEAELGGKAYRTQHPHRILPVTGIRIADQANHPGLQVVHAVGEIHH